MSSILSSQSTSLRRAQFRLQIIGTTLSLAPLSDSSLRTSPTDNIIPPSPPNSLTVRTAPESRMKKMTRSFRSLTMIWTQRGHRYTPWTSANRTATTMMVPSMELYLGGTTLPLKESMSEYGGYGLTSGRRNCEELNSMLLNTRSLAIHVPVCVNSAEGMVVEFLFFEDAQCFILVSLSHGHERWCLGCIFVAATLRLRECCSLRSTIRLAHRLPWRFVYP